MRRQLLVLSALFALVVSPIVRAQEATPPADVVSAALSRTDARYVVPFTSDGLNAALSATATEEGTCAYESSAVLGRPDAWDCISESNAVYDPCFENPYPLPDEPTQVACFDSPFSTDVVLLTLTEPLVREKETTDNAGPPGADDEGSIEAWDLPWALELANGDQCALLHGTLTVVAGQVAHYGCVDGGTVFGETDRSQPVWTVNYLPDGAFASSVVDVVVAWS